MESEGNNLDIENLDPEEDQMDPEEMDN